MLPAALRRTAPRVRRRRRRARHHLCADRRGFHLGDCQQHDLHCGGLAARLAALAARADLGDGGVLHLFQGGQLRSQALDAHGAAAPLAMLLPRTPLTALLVRCMRPPLPHTHPPHTLHTPSTHPPHTLTHPYPLIPSRRRRTPHTLTQPYPPPCTLEQMRWVSEATPPAPAAISTDLEGVTSSPATLVLARGTTQCSHPPVLPGQHTGTSRNH